MKVYGIKNCNTVKKALDWLDANNIAYEFHDFKKSGISIQKLAEWDAKQDGYEKLMNKQGLTWKQLDSDTKQAITNKNEAFNLLQEKTSIIKRPVIEDGDYLFFGFNEAAYAGHFLK